MIVLKGITLRRGAKVVLEDASVTLNPGEKVGLVGRNGAGKSSLFAMLAGRLHADIGDCDIPPRWRLAEVAQTLPETEQPATDFVLEGDLPLMAARAALAEAEHGGDGHAIAEAHEALAHAGEFDANSRAQSLLLGLGFKTSQLDAPVNSFSGGWRMRLQLARALMCPADLMLLDEPTNHLDLDALVWLEAWLQRFEGTLVIISHDREFLDAITRVTVHLDDGKINRYGGNYSTFEAMLSERQTHQQAAFERQQERMAQLQRFIDRFKAKASKAKQAQSRVKALGRMEKLAPVLTASDFSFEFREPASLPNPMLVLDALDCGYGDTAIVRGVSRSVLAGQRIGILGANGQGKSTLVKTIARVLPALGGRMTEGKGLAIGYFAQQEMDLLRADEGALEQFVRLARTQGPAAREQELRDFLGRFRFTGDMVGQPVGTLSGGEQARLVLAMLVWQRPNLLLFDEPTNHLDLSTREALSLALNEYEGTVMVVSHDRALLREVCDEFWLVTKGGVEPFDGDLDDYQRWLLEQSREAQRAAKAGAKAAADKAVAPRPTAAAAPVAAPTAETKAAPTAEGATPKRRDDRKAEAAARQKRADELRPLKRALGKVEAELEACNARRAQLLEAMSGADLGHAERAEQGRSLKQLEEDIARLELQWLELGESIEQFGKD